MPTKGFGQTLPVVRPYRLPLKIRPEPSCQGPEGPWTSAGDRPPVRVESQCDKLRTSIQRYRGSGDVSAELPSECRWCPPFGYCQNVRIALLFRPLINFVERTACRSPTTCRMTGGTAVTRTSRRLQHAVCSVDSLRAEVGCCRMREVQSGSMSSNVSQDRMGSDKARTTHGRLCASQPALPLCVCLPETDALGTSHATHCIVRRTLGRAARSLALRNTINDAS